MLLIDCYNVLHTPMPPMLAGLDEAGLCRALARTSWAASGGGGTSGGGIVIVADGRPKPLGTTQSPVDSVELIYSGQSRTADAVIIEMVNDHSSPRRVTVVSTDRQIREAARRRRCTVWTSEQFITKLVDQLRGNAGASLIEPDKPTGALPEQEVEAWLEAFGVDDSALSSSLPRQGGFGDAKSADEPAAKSEDTQEPDNPDDEFNIPGLWPPPDVERGA